MGKDKVIENPISLQRWIKIHESKNANNFMLLGKNKDIQTDKQILKKFYKHYSLF